MVASNASCIENSSWSRERFMTFYPKYKMLFDILNNEISSGVYRPGEKLPSEHALSMQYGMSRQTVRQAMALLESDDSIERIQGSGTYVKTHALGKNSSHNIAVIATYIDEYIFPHILRDMQDTFYRAKYSSLLFATHNRFDYERKILLELSNKPIDGIVVEGTRTALYNPNVDLYIDFTNNGIPVVFFHGYYRDYQAPIYVIADDEGGGKLACEHLFSKGHRRIAGIFKIDDMQGLGRFKGFIKAFMSYNIPISDRNIMFYTTETKHTLDSNSVLQVVKNCSAIICYNDEVAIQVLKVLQKHDIRVPNDISIVSFDNSTYSTVSSPQITSCSLNSSPSFGATVANKLIDILNGMPVEPATIGWLIEEKQSVKEHCEIDN